MIDQDKLIKIQDHDDLVKDPNANAILNQDVDGFNRFKMKRMKEKQMEDRLDSLENSVDAILAAITALSAEMKSDGS